MNTEFRKAIVPDEIRSLMAFDRRVFPPRDRFDAAYWKICEPYWMIVDGIKLGCCAFERHVDFQDDLNSDGMNPHMRGSLYISTTGILPKFQGKGFGRLLKSWEVSFARYHGFKRIVTNTRERNEKMIVLNREFGFRVIRTTPQYYSNPPDSTVVMELLLRKSSFS
jgi:ribosomal protein S18 acetylase RimI-like enzyme